MKTKCEDCRFNQKPEKKMNVQMEDRYGNKLAMLTELRCTLLNIVTHEIVKCNGYESEK